MNRAILGVILVVGLGGCQTETRTVGPPQVKIQTPDTTLVGLERITRADETVGWVKTYRYEDREGLRIKRVLTPRNAPVGYVTQDGRAFRFTAHDGPQLVANTGDLRRDVAAILDLPYEQLRITDEVAKP